MWHRTALTHPTATLDTHCRGHGNKFTFPCTAKPTERQKILTILADSLVMQSVSQEFKFLWKSVQVLCFLSQGKHPH